MEKVSPTKRTLAELVYLLCEQVPEGKVTTYGEIARKLGIKSYRAIGQALRKNHYSYVPCHRVVCSDGSLGGFKGKSDGQEKLRLLSKEKVIMVNNKADLDNCLFKF